MNLPLPITMLLSAGAGSGVAGYEIYLNRSGINTIDTPREKVLAETRCGLGLKIFKSWSAHSYHHNHFQRRYVHRFFPREHVYCG